MSGELPWVEIEPVIWNLDLVSIHNFLLENTISVSQTVTPRGVVEGGHGVQKAGRQSTETSVSESSIVFLTDDILDAETEIVEAV